MMALVLFQLLSQDPAAPIIDGQQLRIMGPFPTALVMLEWHEYTKPQLIIQIYQRFIKAKTIVIIILIIIYFNIYLILQ